MPYNNLNTVTQSCEHVIKLAYFIYNTKSVSITAKDFLPIKEKYYSEGDTVRVPFWYAKLLLSRGVIEPIKELAEYEKRFHKAVSNQKMNNRQLILVDQDFYFEFYDYKKYQLKRDSYRKEKSKRLKEFRDARQSIIMNTLRSGLSTNKSQLACMTFEEILFYEHAIRAKNDPYCIYNRGVNECEKNQEVDE